MQNFHVKTYSIGTIQNFFADCKFAVPEIQREFVWNGQKACSMFDSIYRKLPIGTLMVWEADRQKRNLLRESLRILPEFNHDNKKIWFLIDGQQRLAVLYQAKKGLKFTNDRGRVVDFNRITFGLNSNNGGAFFHYRIPVPEEFVPVHDILASNWRRRLRHLPGYKLKAVEKCRKSILQYRIPIMFMRTPHLDEVRTLFIRINSLGTPVSSADRAFAQASKIRLRHLVHQARENLGADFRRLPDFPVLLLLAFARGERDVGERAVNAVLSKLEKRLNSGQESLKKFTKTWFKLRTSLGKAVDYLRGNFNVLNYGFLPSDNMLVTLAYFFYQNGGQPNSIQKRELRKWFWATAVGQRYSGRGYRQNILDDLRSFERLAKNKKGRFSFPEKVLKSDIWRTDYSGRSSLTTAFFCLLARKSPKYLENGDPIPLIRYSTPANSKQKHHIFPAHQLKRRGFSRKEYNSLCNICFIVSEENQSIGSKRPSTYLAPVRRKKHFPKVMRSHLIPYKENSGLWEETLKKGYKKFVRQRADLICKAFEAEAGITLFRKD